MISGYKKRKVEYKASTSPETIEVLDDEMDMLEEGVEFVVEEIGECSKEVGVKDDQEENVLEVKEKDSELEIGKGMVAN